MCVSLWCAGVVAQEKPINGELPQRSEISGITPDVLVRTNVPGAPGKIEIVTRTTYQPAAELRRHYHTSQIVFYIVEGSMGVQEDGKEPVTLKPGDTLLIKPGTVHRHWNLSRMAPLIFTEFILVDEGQRSAGLRGVSDRCSGTRGGWVSVPFDRSLSRFAQGGGQESNQWSTFLES
jgi:quercetin dioxygenase-like cupin family protein